MTESEWYVGEDMAQDGDTVVTAPDMARDIALDHVYGVMYCLMVLGEAGVSGAVTRATHIGQAELWPTITYLGGHARGYADWREARERPTSAQGREV